MKKMNRTYLMGTLALLLAAFIAWQTTMIPERMVSNEPGPKLFPFISAGGIAVFAVLSMIFDGPKDDGKPYLDKAGWIRMLIIIVEVLFFCFMMNFIGFWIAAMMCLFLFFWTLKGDKKSIFPLLLFWPLAWPVSAILVLPGASTSPCLPALFGRAWESKCHKRGGK